MTKQAQRKCRTCGEPELLGLPDSGEFGWFDDADNRTHCNRCGSNPLRKPRKAKAKAKVMPAPLGVRTCPVPGCQRRIHVSTSGTVYARCLMHTLRLLRAFA